MDSELPVARLILELLLSSRLTKDDLLLKQAGPRTTDNYPPAGFDLRRSLIISDRCPAESYTGRCRCRPRQGLARLRRIMDRMVHRFPGRQSPDKRSRLRRPQRR